MPEIRKQMVKKYFENRYCQLKIRLNNNCYRNKIYFVNKYQTWLYQKLNIPVMSAEKDLKRPAPIDELESSGLNLKPFSGM